MTIFEIIILGIIYLFCLSFSIESLMGTECDKIEGILLFLFVLLCAPLITVVIIGAFIADNINKIMK